MKSVVFYLKKYQRSLFSGTTTINSLFENEAVPDLPSKVFFQVLSLPEIAVMKVTGVV